MSKKAKAPKVKAPKVKALVSRPSGAPTMRALVSSERKRAASSALADAGHFKMFGAFLSSEGKQADRFSSAATMAVKYVKQEADAHVAVAKVGKWKDAETATGEALDIYRTVVSIANLASLYRWIGTLDASVADKMLTSIVKAETRGMTDARIAYRARTDKGTRKVKAKAKTAKEAARERILSSKVPIVTADNAAKVLSQAIQFLDWDTVARIVAKEAKRVSDKVTFTVAS